MLYLVSFYHEPALDDVKKSSFVFNYKIILLKQDNQIVWVKFCKISRVANDVDVETKKVFQFNCQLLMVIER